MNNDAKRYQFIREFGYGLPYMGKELDDKIDAAIAAAPLPAVGQQDGPIPTPLSAERLADPEYVQAYVASLWRMIDAISAGEPIAAPATPPLVQQPEQVPIRDLLLEMGDAISGEHLRTFGSCLQRERWEHVADSVLAGRDSAAPAVALLRILPTQGASIFELSALAAAADLPPGEYELVVGRHKP